MAINSGNDSPQSPPPSPPPSSPPPPPPPPPPTSPPLSPPLPSGVNVLPIQPTGQTNATPPVEGIRIGGSYTLQSNVPCLESTLRKRTRDGGDAGAGPSVPPLQRSVPAAAAAVAAAVAAAFVCAICGLRFDAEKSLAGHMRMHPGRQWRGMFPPPVFTRDDFADVIDLLNQPEEEEEGAGAAAAEENDEANDGGAGEDAAGRRFNLPDLNKTP